MVSGSYEIKNGFSSPSPKKGLSPSTAALLSGEKLSSRSLKKAEASLEDEDFAPKRKLRPNECEGLYNRMMLYEQRKRKAIQMMQEARRKEEDDEYLQSVHNSNKQPRLILCREDHQ